MNRFDICEGFYMHAVINAGNMWSLEYQIHARLERMRFRPSPMLRSPSDLSEGARAVYDSLASGDSLVRYTR